MGKGSGGAGTGGRSGGEGGAGTGGRSGGEGGRTVNENAGTNRMVPFERADFAFSIAPGTTMTTSKGKIIEVVSSNNRTYTLKSGDQVADYNKMDIMDAIIRKAVVINKK